MLQLWNVKSGALPLALLSFFAGKPNIQTVTPSKKACPVQSDP
jgi:hypothetical protein